MSAESTATDFDPAAVSAALVGTWRWAQVEEPGGVAFFHFAGTGRPDLVRGISWVLVPSSGSNGDWRAPFCPWYSVESPSELRYRYKPDDEGLVQTYRFDGETLTISWKTITVLHRATPDEIPEWFHQRLAAFLAKNA